MNEKMPLFEQLDALGDDAERADWLWRISPALLLTYQATIKARFRARDWPEALAFIDARLTALRRNADEHGWFALAAYEMCEAARVRLAESVAGRAGR
ncbi:hypothetical protein [Rhizobium halophytocola]|uniref:Uncharacterized protein n=1 Tax=Rhizobium halophytocola TaxID=735519 RepID=A0ABS4E2H9_9HYPH|nr:hypothetical protein [Rhizobium halophytocola]MBP1852137.1 hypothetical protein [Rhizobium halophytocola]